MLRAKYLTAEARKKLLRWVIDNKRLNNYNKQTSKFYRLYICVYKASPIPLFSYITTIFACFGCYSC